MVYDIYTINENIFALQMEIVLCQNFGNIALNLRWSSQRTHCYMRNPKSVWANPHWLILNSWHNKRNREELIHTFRHKMKIYRGIKQPENRNSSRVFVDYICPRAKTIICNQICTHPCFCPPSNSPHCMDSLCVFDGGTGNSFYLMPQNTSDGGADNGRCRRYLQTEPVFTCQLQNHNNPAKV